MSSLADTLAALVEIPSETGSEDAITTAIASRLAGQRPMSRLGNALVVGAPQPDRPLFALYGHTDTVPAQNNRSPTISDGRMAGLGTSDMKAGLAVMIHLLEDETVGSGSRDVVGVFYDREEGPVAENGLESVLDTYPWLLDAELSVVLEPTDLAVEVGCNGAMNAEVVFVGRSSHSARPWHGENAVTRSGAWLAEMYARAPEPVTIDGLEFLEVFSVTRASGGIANNIIPDRFILNLNYRFPPLYGLEEAEERLRMVAAAADEVTVTDRAPAGAVPRANEHLQRLEELSGRAPAAKQGWTDVARISDRGAPAVNYGPGEVAQAHQASESVALANLDEAIETLRSFLG